MATEQISVTLTREDWEDVVGGLFRAAADSEHAADRRREPDERRDLMDDAATYRRISRTIEETVG